MSKPYPVPPLPLKSSGALVQKAADKLNLVVTPNVAAIITEPYERAQRLHPLRHVLGLWLPGEGAFLLGGVAAAHRGGRPAIARSAPNSYVREISVNDAGRATGVIYFETRRTTIARSSRRPNAWCWRPTARRSPRLLLMSKSNRFQKGLANSSGVVGKYLMTGNGGGASGLFSDPLNEYKGCVTGAAVLSYVPNDVKGRGWYGGGRMTARGQMSPIQYGLSGPRNAPSWGAGYKKALIEQANRRLTMVNFISQLPLETNMVDLDPEAKDAWGLPALRITTTSHENDFKAMRFFIDKSVEILKAAGATEVWADTVNRTAAAVRMPAAPAAWATIRKRRW